MTGRRRRLSARELLERLLDDDSLRSWDDAATAGPTSTAPEYAAEYAAELIRARRRSGEDEAILTGEGCIRGRRVAVAVSEFGFLGGSIGLATADRLVRAIERATAERLPLVVAPTSGGTRMQEGTAAFVQMVSITAAVVRHKDAGLPYLVYLRDPTTGGVLASWAALGHVTLAEPGAMIGFLGPRVHQALTGEEFPPGVQVAENLHAHGLVDQVVPVSDLAEVVDRVLRLTSEEPHRVPTWRWDPGVPVSPDDPLPSPWELVSRSRAPERPGVSDLLQWSARDVVALGGTDVGGSERGMVLAMCRFGVHACVVVGQDRRAQARGARLGARDLRLLHRGARLAGSLGLPLVSFIDTPGAELSRRAEEEGLAMEIAECLAALVALDVPSVSVLLGEGAGGGALALLPADRILAVDDAWLAPLPPEGASAIVHRDLVHAPEMAERHDLSATRLRDRAIVDEVIAGPSGPGTTREFCHRVGAAVERSLSGLLRLGDSRRAAERARKFARLGRAPARATALASELTTR